MLRGATVDFMQRLVLPSSFGRLPRCFLLLLLLISTTAASLGASPDDSRAGEILAYAPSAEWPGLIVQRILTSPATNQAAVTRQLIIACLKRNPGLCLSVVVAVAREVPSMAGVAAAAAAGAQPRQAVAVARAAAKTCPERAAEITRAVCAEVPRSYVQVAEAVTTVVPKASREILMAVAAAVPHLKGAIEQRLASQQDGEISVNAILTYAKSISPQPSSWASVHPSIIAPAPMWTSFPTNASNYATP